MVQHKHEGKNTSKSDSNNSLRFQVSDKNMTKKIKKIHKINTNTRYYSMCAHIKCIHVHANEKGGLHAQRVYFIFCSQAA